MKKSIFILFMISGLFKGYSQISNYKYLDEDTKKTVLFDKYFHLFYSLKDYEVENVFFLKNGILLWDKIHSKFTLLDYNSKTMLDEYTLSSKKGFKKKNYNYYNPFIFNAQSKPIIIDKNKVFIGLVKTKRKLGYKGFQILNLSINNNRIILNLNPFKPDEIFHGFEYTNPNFPSVKYELAEGLAALQLVNAFPIDTNNAGIRGVNTEEDVHQRGFTRAVLAKKSQDIPRIEGQIDIVIGLDRAENLRDSFHFQQRNRHLFFLATLRKKLCGESIPRTALKRGLIIRFWC